MKSKNTKQISSTIDNNLHEMITAEAQKDNRSFSEMVGILLFQAMKERIRKRKNT